MNAPTCGNLPPYCTAGRRPMKCVEETGEEFVFVCMACKSTQILTSPERRMKMRKEVMKQRRAG